jgi:hypothetical protein
MFRLLFPLIALLLANPAVADPAVANITNGHCGDSTSVITACTITTLGHVDVTFSALPHETGTKSADFYEDKIRVYVKRYLPFLKHATVEPNLSKNPHHNAYIRCVLSTSRDGLRGVVALSVHCNTGSYLDFRRQCGGTTYGIMTVMGSTNDARDRGFDAALQDTIIIFSEDILRAQITAQ